MTENKKSINQKFFDNMMIKYNLRDKKEAKRFSNFKSDLKYFEREHPDLVEQLVK